MEFAAAGADVAINWLDDKAAAQSPCRRQAEGTDALVWLMR
jgi:hypothetical protein